MDLYAELVAIVAQLDAHDIDYALCGALALAVHGAPRATKDIDILARKSDADAVRDRVREAGYTFEALPMTFSSGIEVQRFSKLIDGRPLLLDVLWAEGNLTPIWGRRIQVQWKDGAIWVVSRDDLITLKITAGRPQDLADVQALAKLEGRNDQS